MSTIILCHLFVVSGPITTKYRCIIFHFLIDHTRILCNIMYIYVYDIHILNIGTGEGF